MSTIPLRPLEFGEIVDGAVQLYRRDFGLYYLIALAGAAPGYLINLFAGPDISSLEQRLDASNAAAVFGDLAYMLMVLLITAAIAWVGMVAVAAAMAERIEERQTSLGRAYRDAMRHLPRAAGASILALLVFTAVFFVVLIGVSILAIPFARSDSFVLSVAGITVAGMAIVTVFLAWLAATFAILPAVIIEGRPTVAALRRSLSLCNGGWLRVIGIMTVAMIINIAPGLGVSALFGAGDMFASPEALGTIDSERQWMLNTADLVIGPLTVPFMVGSIMMLFHDRRVRKEAYDLERTADAIGSDAL